MTSTVVVERLVEDPDRLSDQIFASFQKLECLEAFSRAKAIFLKPNLTYPRYKPGVVTRIAFVRSFIEAFTRANGNATIYVGEGEGGYNAFSMDEALKVMGFFDLAERFPRVKILNLSRMPSRVIDLPTPRGPYPIALPAIFFDDVDFAVSLPVPKIHGMTTLTLSMKNLWGCLPDVMRLKNHFLFDHLISQIAQALKFRYAFLDGLVGLNRNGPMVGDPVELGWFVAADSLGAFDAVTAGLMGFSWKSVRHLKNAGAAGLVPAEANIRILGDAAALRKKFVLRRTPWNYPALAAFRSRRLTRLFYFSRYAKVLHDIMYTSRKRPVS